MEYDELLGDETRNPVASRHGEERALHQSPMLFRRRALGLLKRRDEIWLGAATGERSTSAAGALASVRDVEKRVLDLVGVIVIHGGSR